MVIEKFSPEGSFVMGFLLKGEEGKSPYRYSLFLGQFLRLTFLKILFILQEGSFDSREGMLSLLVSKIH